MSFSVEFTAKQADVRKIITQEHLPHTVKIFIEQALRAFKPDALVFVKAQGHLFDNDYQTSTAMIAVQELVLRAPKADA